MTTSPVPFPLPETSSKRKHLGAEFPSMLEKGAIERVANRSLSRVSQPVVCYPQEEWQASTNHRPTVIEPSPNDGAFSHALNPVVILHSNNSSAVGYLQNHLLSMFHLTYNILLECQGHSITLLLKHIPGQLSIPWDKL